MIVTTVERPDLAEVSARWRWEAFFRDTRPWDDVLAAARRTASLKDVAMPRTFLLLADGVPAGTASLVAHDLDERPDLSPWLAGVVVPPALRGRGYAEKLIRAVEVAAHTAGFATLWLYTRTAERVYERAGWAAAGPVEHDGKSYTLMRKELGDEPGVSPPAAPGTKPRP